MTTEQVTKPWYTRIPKWRFKVAIFALPVLFAGAALLFAAESAWFLLHAEKAEGEVVRVYEWDGETFLDGDKVYGPVFRYRWSDGKETEASLAMSHKDWNFPIESKQMILYDPAEKTNLRLPGFFFNWGIPAVLSGLALITFLPALLLWRWLHKKS